MKPETKSPAEEAERLALARALEVQLHSHSPLYLTSVTAREIIAALRSTPPAAPQMDAIEAAAIAGKPLTVTPQDGWRNIDTAPKDGTPVLVWFRGRLHVAEYSAIFSRENMHWCVRDPATGESDIVHMVHQIDPPTINGKPIPGCWEGPSHWKPLDDGPFAAPQANPQEKELG